MKYLKLKTIEKLPEFTKNLKVKQSHITFAYFGDVESNNKDLTEILSSGFLFKLNKSHIDFFGIDKNIPVVVYSIDNSIDNSIHNIRSKLINKFNLTDQNFGNWNPHISSVNFDDCPDVINVIGIESDDDTFIVNFK